MNKDYRPIHFALASLIAFALLGYSCSGCPPRHRDQRNESPHENVNQSTPNNNTKSEPTAPPAADSKVSRRNTNVTIAAKQQEPEPLIDNGWHDLNSGDRIATDASGEAEVNIQNCMRVFVFRDSQLRSSVCPKVVSQTGNTYCAQQGTSLFNNSCGSKLRIQTDSAELTLEGTYFSVTYLPDQELTLVWVLQGKVRVRPIVNGEPSGEPVEVAEGQFVITLPEEKKPLVPQLDPSLLSGQPFSLDRFREAVVTLKLQPWMERILVQARTDQIRITLGGPKDAVAANQSIIDCDCDNVSTGLGTAVAQRQCRAAENNLKAELARTGNVTGKCDGVASGPNARPK